MASLLYNTCEACYEVAQPALLIGGHGRKTIEDSMNVAWRTP
jgi:hypothetical protein